VPTSPAYSVAHQTSALNVRYVVFKVCALSMRFLLLVVQPHAFN